LPTVARILLGCAAVGLIAIAGCKDKTKTDDPGTEPAPTGDSVVAKRHVELSPENVKKGKAAFGACMGCHGEAGEGRIGIGPRLASETFLAAAGDDFLISNIKNGRAGTTMVAWKESFSDQQVEAVVAYLRSLQPVAAATLDESELKGNAEEGAVMFRGVCSSCHGRSGGGYQETANGTGIGRKVFLDKASNGFIRHIVKSGKSHTAMRGFAEKDPMAVANLTDQQVDDIIAHLRANAW
jgi:cytochrome c oxidase cbb3-type subunit 3